MGGPRLLPRALRLSPRAFVPPPPVAPMRPAPSPRQFRHRLPLVGGWSEGQRSLFLLSCCVLAVPCFQSWEAVMFRWLLNFNKVFCFKRLRFGFSIWLFQNFGSKKAFFPCSNAKYATILIVIIPVLPPWQFLLEKKTSCVSPTVFPSELTASSSRVIALCTSSISF
jgi:hypothetical protein